ncbi:hypothetical protein KGF56_003607 [Candida oxycetoniae]|uniref:Uncharacterized protein n=1 Tax=Candida oxycetoniae TaxID=497107 RepID=A0AAI9WWU5_9ASCO|nr:uncharacterized protein KGF56_003607 [Candida oxycetoniae]KAI3403562.2 hypothetical protein KGF56_003607 [Candida oxycetoniae]
MDKDELVQRKKDLDEGVKEKDSEDNTWPTIHELERYYYEIYQKLSYKLNHLIYLTKLKDLTDTPVNKLADEITKIQQEFMIPSSLQDLYRYLVLANRETKINDLLNRYFMMLNPVQKAIHHADLNTSEQKILEYLNILYDDNDDNRGGKQGLAFQIQNLNQLRRVGGGGGDDYEEDTDKVKKQKQEIRSLSQEIASLNVDLDTLTLKVQDLNTKDDLVSTLKQNTDKLVQNWHQIDGQSRLILELVCSLPYAWYEEDSEEEDDGGGQLVHIMLQLNEIQTRLHKYQSIIDRDAPINEFGIKNLTDLKFDE